MNNLNKENMKYITSIYPLLSGALILSLFAVQSCVDQPGSQEEELNKLKQLQSEQTVKQQPEKPEKPVEAQEVEQLNEQDTLHPDTAGMRQKSEKMKQDSIAKAAEASQKLAEEQRLKAIDDSMAQIEEQLAVLQQKQDSLQSAEEAFLQSMAARKEANNKQIQSLNSKLQALEQQKGGEQAEEEKPAGRQPQKSEKIKKDSTIEDSVIYVPNPDLQRKDSLQKGLSGSFYEDQKKLEELDLEISKKKEQIEAIKRELSSSLDKLRQEQEKVVAKAKEKAATKDGGSNTLLVVLLTTIIVVLILYLLGKDQGKKKK